MARARGEETDEMNNAMGQMTPLPSTAAAEFYPLTPSAEAGGELAAGGRPARPVEPQGAQEQLRGSVVQQIVDLPFVAILVVEEGPPPNMGKVRR